MGCSAADLGITPGGAQDTELAESIIESGYIPAESQFQIEGLFSEHDLPLDGPACNDVLCPRGAVALHTSIGETEERVLVQIGFGSNVDAATFAREPLDVAAVVDVSCSMDGGKLELANEALGHLVDELAHPGGHFLAGAAATTLLTPGGHVRSGTLQLQLDDYDTALGTWWCGRGREATGLLRRHLPDLALDARSLADLLDGDAVLVVVRVGGRAVADVCAEEAVRVRVASLASGIAPRQATGRRRAPIRRPRQGKTEAA